MSRFSLNFLYVAVYGDNIAICLDEVTVVQSLVVEIAHWRCVIVVGICVGMSEVMSVNGGAVVGIEILVGRGLEDGFALGELFILLSPIASADIFQLFCKDLDD